MKTNVAKGSTAGANTTQATSAFDTNRNQTFDGIAGQNDSLF